MVPDAGTAVKGGAVVCDGVQSAVLEAVVGLTRVSVVSGVTFVEGVTDELWRLDGVVSVL